MRTTRRQKLTDMVKVELGLSNGQYEAIYTAFATRMQEEGLIGAQMRSIQSKVAARRIGAEVRRDHRKALSGVSDATFDANVLRIAQRINSNTRRVKQRKGQADARRKETNNDRDIESPYPCSTSQPGGEPQTDVSGGRGIVEKPRSTISPGKRLLGEDYVPDPTAHESCEMAQVAQTVRARRTTALRLPLSPQPTKPSSIFTACGNAASPRTLKQQSAVNQ